MFIHYEIELNDCLFFLCEIKFIIIVIIEVKNDLMI